jgi:hypothetical protein
MRLWWRAPEVWEIDGERCSDGSDLQLAKQILLAGGCVYVVNGGQVDLLAGQAFVVMGRNKFARDEALRARLGR